MNTIEGSAFVPLDLDHSSPSHGFRLGEIVMIQARPLRRTLSCRRSDYPACITGNAAPPQSAPVRAELGHLLRDAKMPSGTMDLVTLEGFLTALVIGPATSTTENWLPAVWVRAPRRRTPVCLRAPGAYARFRELVLQYHAEIARQFKDSPESFQPTFCAARFGGIAATIVDPWCIGFVARMDMKPRSWRPLQRECPDLLRPILLYGTHAGWEERHRVNDPAAFHAEWWPQIAPAVHGIHRYWCARNHSSGNRTPVHEDA